MAFVESLLDNVILPIWDKAICPLSWQAETDPRSDLPDEVRLTFLHNMDLKSSIPLRLACGIAVGYLAFELDGPALAVIAPPVIALADSILFMWLKSPADQKNFQREQDLMNGRVSYF